MHISTNHADNIANICVCSATHSQHVLHKEIATGNVARFFCCAQALVPWLCSSRRQRVQTTLHDTQKLVYIHKMLVLLNYLTTNLLFKAAE